MENVRKYLPAAVVAVLGVLISVGAYIEVERQQRKLAEQNFLRTAAERVAALRGRVDKELVSLRAVVGLFESSQLVDRDEFKAFIGTMYTGALTSTTMEWVPRIRHANRAYYEQVARDEGVKDFTITERSPSGAMVPAQARDVYFPVYYVEPMKGNELVVGFDMGTSAQRLAAMESARNSGDVVVTERIELVQFAENRAGVLMLAPVYEPGRRHDTVEFRREHLKGFAMQVVRLSDLFGMPRDAAKKAENTAAYHLSVYDESAGGTELYVAHGHAAGVDEQDLAQADGPLLEERIAIGGRIWRLVMRSADVNQFNFARTSWLASAVALLITALLAAMLVTSARKREEVMNTVRERTDELRRATQRALHNEARTKAIIDNSSEGLIVIGSAGKVETFNHAAERTFGFGADEVLGRDVSILMPEQDRTEHMDYVRHSTLYAPRIINKARELKGRRKDGSLFDMELNVTPLQIGDEKKFVGVFRDVSERKAADAALRASEERFKDFTDTASDWIWETDADLRFIFVSERFFEITHLAPADVIGKLRWEYVDVDNSGVSAEEWAQHRADLESHVPFRNFRYQLKDQLGEVRHISLNGKPVFAPDGTFQGYRGTGSDTTNLVEATEALRVAKDEAEAANRAKSKFLSAMSHELRTPLNAILGFGQLLKADPKQPLTETQTNAVSHILSSGQHLLGLINDVLDLAKVESGDVSLSVEDVEPGAVIADCCSMAASMGAKRGIVVINECPTQGLPWIRADLTRFRQVLLNFLSNAVKYNSDGGRVTLACEQRPEGALRFSVADTGPGLSQQQQRDLFQPFNRLGMETSSVEGTGIGLVITRELVHLMQGAIGFDSTPGEGSTFWFELPVSAGTRAAVPSSERAAPVSAGTTPSGAVGTVLYVEDNPANIALMERIVELFENVTLVTSVRAEEGLDIAQRNRPDLILMDINLPGMDGIAALGELRRNPKTADIPVVAVSANAMPHDVKRAMDAGFAEYLTKPIDVPDVVAVINAHLSAHPKAATDASDARG